MSSLPRILIDFAERVRGRFGPDAAGCNDDGVFVFLGDTMVHVFLDRNSTRAVAWTELRRPGHVDLEAMEQAAAAYTGAKFLEKAMAVGVDRAADLVVLGRSFDQEALGNDDGIAIVCEVLREAPAAIGELAATAMKISAAPGGRSFRYN